MAERSTRDRRKGQCPLPRAEGQPSPLQAVRLSASTSDVATTRLVDQSNTTSSITTSVVGDVFQGLIMMALPHLGGRNVGGRVTADTRTVSNAGVPPHVWNVWVGDLSSCSHHSMSPTVHAKGDPNMWPLEGEPGAV